MPGPGRDDQRRQKHPELVTSATATATVGQNISDKATLSGLVNPTGTGTVTFDIYKGADCSGAKLNAQPIAATPATVSANGDYTSANFNTAATGAGTYHWIAHFSGDANNKRGRRQMPRRRRERRPSTKPHRRSPPMQAPVSCWAVRSSTPRI